MSKTEYYDSSSELEIALVKLKSMDENGATMLFSIIELDTPPAKLLSKEQRGKTYRDISLKALEYLWIGCEGSDMKIRLSAKASYLCRCNEDNHPRRKLLFSYAENRNTIEKDEAKMLKDLYNLTVSVSNSYGVIPPRPTILDTNDSVEYNYGYEQGLCRNCGEPQDACVC